MTDLTPFTFDGQAVRAVVGPNGEPLFVLADVCAVLGIANPSNVASRLDADDLRTVEVVDGLGRRQPNTRAVTESGVIDVTLDSRKPDARRFRRWLTHDVVPQIMQTGSYGTPALTGPALVAAALIEAQVILAAKDEQLAIAAPKAEYVDLFVADGDLIKFRTVAARLDIGENELRNLLLAHGWIYVETFSRWSDTKQAKETVRRYSAYGHKKAHFTPVIVHDAPRFKGEAMHTLKVTPMGAHAIAQILPRWQAGEDAA